MTVLNESAGELTFQSICIILMACSCGLHFYSHYHLQFCCCSKSKQNNNPWMNTTTTTTNKNGKKMIKPTLSNQRTTSSILIYNNANANNCGCCQIDIMYKELFYKISCFKAKQTDLQCYPLLFLIYHIFSLLIAILTIFTAKYSILYMTLIFFIIISILWELLFNYYRYYSTFHCVQTLNNNDNSYKYYCKIFMKFSIYGISFFILFSILFLINYQQKPLLIIIWFILFLLLTISNISANIYCILTSTNLIISQYESAHRGNYPFYCIFFPFYYKKSHKKHKNTVCQIWI